MKSIILTGNVAENQPFGTDNIMVENKLFSRDQCEIFIADLRRAMDFIWSHEPNETEYKETLNNKYGKFSNGDTEIDPNTRELTPEDFTSVASVTTPLTTQYSKYSISGYDVDTVSKCTVGENLTIDEAKFQVEDLRKHVASKNIIFSVFRDGVLTNL